MYSEITDESDDMTKWNAYWEWVDENKEKLSSLVSPQMQKKWETEYNKVFRMNNRETE